MSARNNLKPICILLALTMQAAFANPSNPVVISGQASFSTTGNALSVTNTPGTIINWQAFSIGANDVTRFVQQSAASAVLNRVVSNNPSSILGSLQSNGRVFLINPNGIVFGAGATVDVAGLVASTLNLSNADFLAGNSHFTQVPGAANIGNAGAITAHGDGLSGGQIVLIAPNVANTGVITAANGEILLAAGHSVDLLSTSHPALRVNITAPAGDATNVGQLIASSGSLGLFGTLVRNTGLVSADSATLQGGKIVFKATSRVDAGGTVSAQGAGGGTIAILADMRSGTVNVTGHLDASAVSSPSSSLPAQGGFIETSAAHVQVADTAVVSTFAENGKSGIWLIDPLDFMIAATGGNITGATVSASLGSGNVVIANAAGEGNGDIIVNDAVIWNSAYSLTLNATHDVNVSQPITNRGAGSVNLRADAGAACVAGALNCGTVIFYGPGFVTATTNIYYNPAGSNTAADANGVGPYYSAPTYYGDNVTGTLNAYMLVNDVNQLQAMNTSLSGKYALAANIDATATSSWNAGQGFAPVGNSSTAFTGKFDGLNHTVRNLVVNRPDQNYVGLFGYMGAGSAVRNVGLVGGSMSGNYDVGGLAGYNNYGTISSSYATGRVNGSWYVGGLVGFNVGSVSNSYATGSVNGGKYVGGLAGDNDIYGGAISNSYSTGKVTWTVGFGGGLVGLNWGSVSSSYWDTLTSGTTYSTGGSGLTTAQMKNISSFEWNIANTGGAGTTWRIYEGQSYPLLSGFLTPLTVTANNFTKIYDGMAYSGGNGVSYSQALGETGLYGTLSYGGTAQGAVNAASYVITPGGQYSDQQNYDIRYVNGALTVNPAVLRVAADFLNKRQGASDPAFSYSLTGLQAADSAAGTLTGAQARVAGEAVGAYPVSQGSLALLTGNYTLDYVAGIFSILPAMNTTIDVPGSFFNTILIPGNEAGAGSDNRPPVVTLDGGIRMTDSDAQPLPVCR